MAHFIYKRFLHIFIPSMIICMMSNMEALSIFERIYSKWCYWRMNGIEIPIPFSGVKSKYRLDFGFFNMINRVDHELFSHNIRYLSLYPKTVNQWTKESYISFLKHIYTQEQLDNILKNVENVRAQLQYCKDNKKAIAIEIIGSFQAMAAAFLIVHSEKYPKIRTSLFILGLVMIPIFVYRVATYGYRAIGLPGHFEHSFERLDILEKEIHTRKQLLEQTPRTEKIKDF